MTEQQTPDRGKKIAEIREALRRVELGTYHITAFANLEYWLRFLLSELDIAEKELELFDQRGETIERQLNIIEQLQEENRKLREERDAAVEGYQQQVKYAGELMTKLVSAQQERNMYKSSSEVFYERLKKVWEEREKAFNLLQKIEDEILYFGELVKINLMSTSLEEKAAIFNRKIETLKAEREKLINELQVYANPRNWAGDVFCPPEGVPEHYDDGGQRARDILKEIGVAVEPDRLHDARVKIAKARFSPERLISERDAYGNDCPGGRCGF